MIRISPLLLGLLLSTGSAFAQTSEPGVLRLPTEGPQVLPIAPAPEPGLIVLPAEGDQNATPTEAEEDATESWANPQPARDGGVAAAPQTHDALMPLLPERLLPSQPVAGPSLPEPGVLRLTGERVRQTLTLYIPEGAPPPESLMMTLRSSINVLPDLSVMKITINDGAEQTLPLTQIGDYASFTLPAVGMQNGENKIQLNLSQPHRIWCGPEATFGVFTEIDLTRSGAALPHGALTSDVNGFAMALRAQTGTGRPLPVLSDPETDPAVLRHVTDALSEVIGTAGQISLRSFYNAGPRAYATVALIASDKNQVSFRPGATGALVMQVEYRLGELPDLEGALPPPAPANTSAAPLLPPGSPITFAALGKQDIIGQTHYFLDNVIFRLPDDWLLLSNQRARLVLNYGFAAGLAEGAMLLVKVNGTTVRLLPLDRDGGELKPPLDVDFPANLLHSGVNTLTFEMSVPGGAEDAACLPHSSDMLVVTAASTLDVPPSPPMELAGLVRPLSGLTSAGVRPPPEYAGQGLPLVAAQFAAAMARPLRPNPDISLFITHVNQPTTLPLGDMKVSLRTLQRTLHPELSALETATAQSEETAAPVANAPSWTLGTVPANISPEDLNARKPSILERIWWSIPQFTGEEGIFVQGFEAVRAAAYVGSDETLEQWLEHQSGQALLVRPNQDQPNTLWLILGPSAVPETVAQHLTELRRSRLANGEAAILNNSGTWSHWTPIRAPRLLAVPHVSEWPVVLGNYASWSPLNFTLLTLVFALLSILPMLGYILITRTRRGGRT